MSAALHALVGTGGAWVVYGLLLASVLTVAVIAERAQVLVRERKELALWKAKIKGPLAEGDLARVTELTVKAAGIGAAILRGGLGKAGAAPAAVEERLAASRIEGK